MRMRGSLSSSTTGRLIAAAMSGFVLLALTACSGTSVRKTGPDTRSLAERATERAQLFSAGKFAEAWEYTSPGYRAVITQQSYVERSEIRPVRWLNAEFISEDCPDGETRCEVELDVEVQTQMPTRFAGRLKFSNRVKESWMKLDDVWYFIPAEFRR